MPLAKPKSRPGTALEGIDLLESKTLRVSAPVAHGEHGHLVWALYTRSGRGPDYEVYVLHGDQLVRRHSVRGKTEKSHPVADEDDLHSTLWKLYWRTRDRETPLKSLQEYIRRQTREKARKLHHEAKMQHWQARWKVKTDHTGRGAHHQVVRR